jgi:hypothetical protein
MTKKRFTKLMRAYFSKLGATDNREWSKVRFGTILPAGKFKGVVLDNEWLIYSEGMDEEIFTYFPVDADESPKNVTDVTELVSEMGNEEIDKRVEVFHKAFPARTDESQAYLWYVLC